MFDLYLRCITFLVLESENILDRAKDAVTVRLGVHRAIALEICPLAFRTGSMHRGRASWSHAPRVKGQGYK